MVDHGVDRPGSDMRIAADADAISARICIDALNGTVIASDGVAAGRLEGKCLMICFGIEPGEVVEMGIGMAGRMEGGCQFGWPSPTG